MHEFVLSGAPAKRELGVRTLDIAKRLLDYGFHPPTIYFPLLVDEALMVEPTETETRESLDQLAEAFDAILAEAEDDPETLARRPTPPRSGASTRPRPAASRPSASRSAESEPALRGDYVLSPNVVRNVAVEGDAAVLGDGHLLVHRAEVGDAGRPSAHRPRAAGAA